MLGHLGLNVPDLVAARAYYDVLLPSLGFEPFFARPTELAYRPADGKRGTYLFLYEAQEPGDHSRHRVRLQHLAFMVPTRTVVRQVHAAAVARGDEVVHEPQDSRSTRPPISPPSGSTPSGSCSKPCATTTASSAAIVRRLTR